MKFEMHKPVPPGTYTGKLTKIDEFAENIEQYGVGVKFSFEILDGEFAGSETSRITGSRLTPKSALGKMLTALRGGRIEPGEEIDTQALIGNTYMLVVQETESGSTRVETAIKVKT